MTGTINYRTHLDSFISGVVYLGGDRTRCEHVPVESVRNG
jgi:hypothetical protein